MLNKKSLFVVAILYTLLLATASLISLKSIPSPQLDHWDKIAHVGAYALLFGLWFLAFKKEMRLQRIVVIAFLCILYGIILEAIQGMLTSERSSDLLDVIANAIGVIAAAIVMALVSKVNVKKPS